ncbi:SDR family oxidoreductase [Arthrobacter sp. NPDC080073]|uniref:SDR family NAD(P)-dependent oxidoreductase n=1 Tax=Arthrobacter sp. NPDC080073 TaxID=3155919 RepID=UPI00344378EB
MPSPPRLHLDVLAKYALTGRKAVVTGGNRGLGLAFVRALFEAGAQVVFISRDGARNDLVVPGIRTEGYRVAAPVADLTSKTELADAIDSAASRLGGIDILVNNSGTCFHGGAVDVKEEEWDAVFDLSVKALFNASVLAAEHMKGNGGGSIEPLCRSRGNPSADGVADVTGRAGTARPETVLIPRGSAGHWPSGRKTGLRVS